MGIWRTPDGTQVEPIVLGNRPVLRVSRRVDGKVCSRAYVASVDELGAHGVDLAELREAPAA
ncbi:hypothetical protein OIE66_13785 [Nonomuraea sp. NBC_01738]|uniref:hypothetical protein n=1 Tax=Nonomuraea sp. NBC_01738 TaxID=2976003 RepID=UPI002E12622F|nr:hypothetical protein OIE66_13785 [Nonomuraea sp. NBC_01738]